MRPEGGALRGEGGRAGRRRSEANGATARAPEATRSVHPENSGGEAVARRLDARLEARVRRDCFVDRETLFR